MATIYSFLKNVWNDIRQETNSNLLFLPFLLVLITIPMRYAYNSITTGIFIGVSLLAFRRSKVSFERALLLPVLLYGLMALSFFWSIDVAETQKALFKIFPLLLIPLCFWVNPAFSEEQRRKILNGYGYSLSVFALFYLIRASYRFIITKDSGVFFYHELVTDDVNAIHVSVFMVVAYFSLLTKSIKKIIDFMALGLITLTIVLLSSKNVIVIFLLLNLAYLFLFLNSRNRKKIILFGLAFGLFAGLLLFEKIKNRFEIEIESNLKENTINKTRDPSSGIVYNVTVNEAWNSVKFEKNDFFPGAAMRVYQLRIFFEMMQRDQAYLTGYGLNATDSKIKEKRIEHNLYEGYDQFNFHNQYVQLFAEIGALGFLLIVIMVFFNLKNGIRSKDFTHISFAVLMISLFLTESFLSRQRGIVFFIALYCFFNSMKTVPPKTEGE